MEETKLGEIKINDIKGDMIGYPLKDKPSEANEKQKGHNGFVERLKELVERIPKGSGNRSDALRRHTQVMDSTANRFKENVIKAKNGR